MSIFIHTLTNDTIVHDMNVNDTMFDLCKYISSDNYLTMGGTKLPGSSRHHLSDLGICNETTLYEVSGIQHLIVQSDDDKISYIRTIGPMTMIINGDHISSEILDKVSLGIKVDGINVIVIEDIKYAIKKICNYDEDNSTEYKIDEFDSEKKLKKTIRYKDYLPAKYQSNEQKHRFRTKQGHILLIY